MIEMLDAALLIQGILPNWLLMFFHAMNIPFLMTIGFVVFVRYIMMPLCEKWLDCGELKKVDAAREKNKLSGHTDAYKGIARNIVEKKVGTFLTGENFAQQKKETISGIDKFLK